jgi:hypothetical protein
VIDWDAATHPPYNHKHEKGTTFIMDKHVAEVTLLESFDLGKNTKKSAGIAIKVFDKASGKRGTQLGTINIGQGSFAWWAANAKTENADGTMRKPTLRLPWSDFANLMKKQVDSKS